MKKVFKQKDIYAMADSGGTGKDGVCCQRAIDYFYAFCPPRSRPSQLVFELGMLVFFLLSYSLSICNVYGYRAFEVFSNFKAGGSSNVPWMWLVIAGVLLTVRFLTILMIQYRFRYAELVMHLIWFVTSAFGTALLMVTKDRNLLIITIPPYLTKVITYTVGNADLLRLLQGDVKNPFCDFENIKCYREYIKGLDDLLKLCENIPPILKCEQVTNLLKDLRTWNETHGADTCEKKVNVTGKAGCVSGPKKSKLKKNLSSGGPIGKSEGNASHGKVESGKVVEFPRFQALHTCIADAAGLKTVYEMLRGFINLKLQDILFTSLSYSLTIGLIPSVTANSYIPVNTISTLLLTSAIFTFSLSAFTFYYFPISLLNLLFHVTQHIGIWHKKKLSFLQAKHDAINKLKNSYPISKFSQHCFCRSGTEFRDEQRKILYFCDLPCAATPGDTSYEKFYKIFSKPWKFLQKILNVLYLNMLFILFAFLTMRIEVFAISQWALLAFASQYLFLHILRELCSLKRCYTMQLQELPT